MKDFHALRSRLILGVSALLSLGPGLRAASADALTPAPLQSVVIDDAFWSPKLDLWRQTTLNDVFSKFEQYGAFQNFDRVAAGQTGGHQGDPWVDGLVYETLRAAGDFLATHPDPVLQQRVRSYVTRIVAAAAKDPDGYLNTDQQLDGVGIKWTSPAAPGDTHDDIFPHTIYNASCMMEAAVHLYKGTGDIELLKVATKLANYMCRIMGPAPKQNIIPGHAIGEATFVELYRLYRDEPGLKARVGLTVNEPDYLNLAQFWIEARGNTTGRATAGAYNQDDISVFQQPALEGHAVRAELLAAGIASATLENDRQDYRATAERWWQNMHDARMYLTGGVGAIASSEGFGADYELPNDGYAETCAAAAGGFFSHDMNILTGDAKYADTLERELYNGALACVSLTGNNYFYTNPLTAGPDHRRWVWAGPGLGLTPCCPPMFLKLQSALPGMIYATRSSDVFVNLYIGGHSALHTAAGEVTLTQTTNYPWDGQVDIKVDPSASVTFAVNLRIPSWAKNPVIQVNGQTLANPMVTRGYAVIQRQWSTGDHVALQLPMPVEKVKSDSRVKANLSRTALMRGPLVYCFEGLDNADATRSLLLGAGDTFTATYQPSLLGGVTVLQGRSSIVRNVAGVLKKEAANVYAIPFFANQNRAATTMDVWVADGSEAIVPGTGGIASSSYCNPTDTVTAMNDGVLPKASDDDSIPRMTWWNHKGTTEWAQLTYDTARTISSVDVYWWDERRVGRECRVPQSWQVQYLSNGGQWQSVQGAGTYGVAMDRFNHVSFQGVQTTAIRIVAQLQAGWAGGILEMYAGTAAPATASASQTFALDTVTAVNDGRLPSSSDDDTIPRHTFWDHKGTREWVQLTFDQPRLVSSLETYWWDERRVGRDCRVPQWWTLSYLDKGVWKPVQTSGTYGTQMDQFNRVDFTAVSTTALRVDVQLQSDWSAGVLEIRTYEPGAASLMASWLTDHGYSTSTDVDSDPDGDGVTLFTAYALGLDPAQNPRTGMPAPVWSADGLSLKFWGAREDVTYAAEQSPDLQHWDATGMTLSAPDANGMRTVTLPHSAASGFIRLQLHGTN